MEQALLNDNDWSIVADELCRVKEFTPMAAEIQGGKVISPIKTIPYASVTIECRTLLHPVNGLICHKLDFKNLWAAFNERPLSEDEEVHFIWTKRHLKKYARLFSKAMPRLWVMVCPKGAFDLATDPNFRPELSGVARWNAMRPKVCFVKGKYPEKSSINTHEPAGTFS